MTDFVSPLHVYVVPHQSAIMGDDVGLTMLLVDFKNAFNLVDREVMLQKVRIRCPSISRWVEFCYSSPTRLYYGEHTILSCQGVQQGDPLGPLLFALVLHPLIYVFWPKEDPKSRLASVFPSNIARPLHGVKLLGGSASVDFDFSSQLVMKRVAKFIELMDVVAKINDPQCELLLLRACAGISKLYFSMRTCSPQVFERSQCSFDVALRSALERIVTASGLGFNDDTIIGDTLVVGKVLELIIEDGPCRGLHLNVDKTDVFWPKEDSKSRLASVFPSNIARPLHGVKLLGGPASVDFDFSSRLVMKRVAKFIELMDVVAKINDPQCELLLLRACAGISKLFFSMRTCSPRVFERSQCSFDVALCSAFERIVTASGLGFSDWHWRLTILPFAFGGLGVYSAGDILNYAFLASRLQLACKLCCSNILILLPLGLPLMMH
nr:hypothetical protein [Tanacetum cinerariifolium]